MHLDRNDLAAAALTERLRNADIGVIVRSITDISPLQVVELAAHSLERSLLTCMIGSSVQDAPSEVNCATDIEMAVEWRNSADAAGRIVVFVNADVPKLHSLNDLSCLTPRDLTFHLLEEATTELSQNEPWRRFWGALKESVDAFPLAIVEDFVRAVDADRDNPEAIPDNLWRIGLLRDPVILHANTNVLERLQRNRELLIEMGQLSENSRKRMSSVIARATGDDRTRLRKAFHELMDFYRRGGTDILRDLDVTTVEELIKAGRPMPISESGAGSNNTDASDGNVDIFPDRPLRGQELTRTVSDMVVSYDEEAQIGLRDLAEALGDHLRNPQETSNTSGIVVNQGFGGRTIQPDQPFRELHALIGHACRDDAWGGLLETRRHDLKDAVYYAQPEEFSAYNPNDPSQGIAGECLFSLMRRFDSYLEGSQPFEEALERMTSLRAQLLDHLDLLLSYPFVLLGGRPDVCELLGQYLSAYGDLLRTFRQHEASLHSRDADAVRYVATELVKLDVVRIHTPTEWKAILTPLHPFHLWRFREILSTVHNGQQPLTEEQQKQLSQALPKLPHLLHFLVFSSEVSRESVVPLPQSGSIGLLPTYENRTNRYLGLDGLHELTDLLKKWLDFAPFSRPQIRLGLVDVPDLRESLRITADFLRSASRATVVVDAYFTRGQYGYGELAQLDYEDADYELAEMLRAERLLVRIKPEESIGAVADALANHPVHIALLFDQSQYQLNNAPRAHGLIVSPLVITYQYDYSESFHQGTIAPSSEASDGLFSDYHFLIERAAFLPAGQQLRLQYEGGLNLEPINGMLQNGATRWLAIADRVLTAYSPVSAVPLSEQRVGQREFGVWAGASSRAVSRLVDLLRRYNLHPNAEIVGRLLSQFGHIAAGGVLSLPMAGGNPAVRESSEKGFLGTILAAAWYSARYPGALIASLDSSLARQWLQMRALTSERADLVGLRIENGNVIVEPIEVKTRADSNAVRVETDQSSGKRMIVGHAADQLISTLDAFMPIFGGVDSQPLFTPARREALKYQVYRECFRNVHEYEWQSKWFRTLNDCFTLPLPRTNVKCQGLVLQIVLEHSADTSSQDDETRDLTLIKLGTIAIQRLVAGSVEDVEPSGCEQEGDSTESELPSEREAQEAMIAVVTTESMVADEAACEATATATQTVAHEDTRSHPTDEAEDLSRRFLRACQSFRVQVDQCSPERAVMGPTVWRFYVRLARGQRLDPLRNALEDMGREMGRSGLIVTTLINSQEIALDIPRQSRDIMPLHRGLECLSEVSTPEEMPFPIGVTPEGQDVVRDLGRIPHLLVGGTTGSGKTMFLYALLGALLTTHTDPRSLRLFLSTSGPEDFVFFGGIPHLEMGEVIVDAALAVELLQTTVIATLNERGDTLAGAHCRDIGEYNSRHTDKMPPLVVIVDEFADLVDQFGNNRAGREAFYGHIRRIAQIGRKRGIHLVLCTQRPSADLVPTNIRNLMNGRIALHVNDATASRMILGEPGAEQLQMHGDLLFKEQAHLVRAQGYYTSTEHLEDMLRSLRA